MSEILPPTRPTTVEAALNTDNAMLIALLNDHYASAPDKNTPLLDSRLEGSANSLEFLHLLHNLVSDDRSQQSWQAGYQAYQFAYSVCGALGLDTSNLSTKIIKETIENAPHGEAGQSLRTQAAEYFQRNPGVAGIVGAFSEDISRLSYDIDDTYQADKDLVYVMAGIAFLQVEHAQVAPEVNKFHEELDKWDGNIN